LRNQFTIDSARQTTSFSVRSSLFTHHTFLGFSYCHSTATLLMFRNTLLPLSLSLSTCCSFASTLVRFGLLKDVFDLTFFAGLFGLCATLLLDSASAPVAFCHPPTHTPSESDRTLSRQICLVQTLRASDVRQTLLLVRLDTFDDHLYRPARERFLKGDH
jgi:hypothetical protein